MRRLVASLAPVLLLSACLAAPAPSTDSTSMSSPAVHYAPTAAYADYDLDTTELSGETIFFFSDPASARDAAYHEALTGLYATESLPRPAYRIDIEALPELAQWYEIRGGGVFVRVDLDGIALTTISEPTEHQLREFLLQ